MQPIRKKNKKTKFQIYGLKSLHILDNHISNPRYLGFSEFISTNVLRNSSYCWSIGRDRRIKDKAYKKYNDNIYNIPSLKSTRSTMQGYGSRKEFYIPLGKGDPSPNAYNILSIFDININKRKGKSFGTKLNYNKKDERFRPGPGSYESKNYKDFGNIPILLKSRQGFFYDDDLKKKKATVSMQRYKPNYKWVEKRRFNGITFGIGDRPKMYALNYFPGPGSYRVPGNFDRGYKGKLPLN
jgi:hypothetical protein